MSGPCPIHADERVSAVLARDAALVEVFAAAAPAFARLRNPSMRRVMSRLVTVEQAARVAGIDPALLLARLNAHIGCAAQPLEKDGTMENTQRAAAPAGEERPPALARIPESSVVVCDVREELRAGREPFSLIMTALRQVRPGGALAVRAIFEPVPLYAALKRHGLVHWTERSAADDWTVWFYADGPAATPASAPAAEVVPGEDAAHAPDGGGDVVVLDVRDLEQPEPMMRTLEALEGLARGATLVQINRRVPQFLLPMLEQRGFTWEVREQGEGLVRLFIRHAAPPCSAAIRE